MNSTYGKLLIVRIITVAINVILIRQMNIPLDLIAMIVGIWVLRPWVRVTIFALEVLNLMLTALGLFFGNYVGGLFGIAVYSFCLYLLCTPEIKERFQ